ncbi:hypothetical protein CIW54_24955 [Paraburkholderia sp. T12-10]|nr:hypothetical protein CIW54_24955 [Paraburkholderia sp. T12-10]
MSAPCRAHKEKPPEGGLLLRVSAHGRPGVCAVLESETRRATRRGKTLIRPYQRQAAVSRPSISAFVWVNAAGNR